MVLSTPASGVMLQLALSLIVVATSNTPGGSLRVQPAFGPGAFARSERARHAIDDQVALHAFRKSRDIHSKPQEENKFEITVGPHRNSNEMNRAAVSNRKERDAALDEADDEEDEYSYEDVLPEAVAKGGGGHRGTANNGAEKDSDGVARRNDHRDAERGRDEQRRRSKNEEDEYSYEDVLPEAVANNIDKQLARAEKVGPKARAAPEEMPKELAHDAKRFSSAFLPGMGIDLVLWRNIFASVAVSVAWYLWYFFRIFRSDALRTEGKYVDGGAEVAQLSEPASCTSIASSTPSFLDKRRFAEGMEPDFVIVLPHPGVDFPENTGIISQSSLGNILTPKLPGVPVDLSKIQALAALEHGTELQEARLALISDLCTMLPRLGFDVGLYSGVCGKKIFLCISMDQPQWIHNYLLWQHRPLQVHRQAVINLNLGPVARVASSPPFLIFDPWVVSRMHEARVLDTDDPAELYVMRDDGYHTEGSIVMRQERIRIIFHQMCASVDLDAAKSKGLIRDWYPGHNLNWVEHIGALWAVPKVLKDIHFEQPIALINNYFGSRIAFAFSWMGLYCKCLLALLLPAMLWEVMSSVFGVPQVLVGSICITMWAKIATNLWDREESFNLESWAVSEDEHNSIIRPQFRGRPAKSPVDESKLELQCPAWELTARWMVSMLVTAAFCLVVVFVSYVWVSLFDGRMGIFASVCLVSMMTVFRFAFNFTSTYLTNWENHKYQPSHYNSLLWKQVFFNFVNYYYAFFYLALKQRYTSTGCPGGCLNLLRRQLVTSLLLLSLVRIGEAILTTLLVRFKLWREEQVRQRELHTEDRPKLCFAETQSNYAEFRIREQIEMMSQLVVSLGFVIMFGSVAPLIVPFSLLVFVVNLRVEAFLLMTSCKRPFPRRAFGIGAWTKVIVAIRGIGALFSSYLLAVYGAMFQGQETITRLSGMFAFCLFVLLLWALVDLVFPSSSPEAELLKERREYVKNRLMEVCAETAHTRHMQDTAAASRRSPRGGRSGSHSPRTAGSHSPRDGGRHGLSPRAGGHFPTAKEVGASGHRRRSLRAAELQRWDEIPTFAEAEATGEIKTDDEGETI